MATRSTIAIQNEDGTVTGIYCHWDGYPKHNGKILVTDYTTEEKVRELIALGDISSLGSTINETVAYGRDRGERSVGPHKGKSHHEFVGKYGEQYNYLFKNGEWQLDGMVINIPKGEKSCM